jgi:hypothetical protein
MSMEKTIEEMRAAVIAELVAIRDETGYRGVKRLEWLSVEVVKFDMLSVCVFDKPYGIKLDGDIDPILLRLLYSGLGLEARDAVEIEKAKAKPLIEVVARVLTMDEDDDESLKYFADRVLSLYDPEQEIELQKCLGSSEDREEWLYFRKTISDLEAKSARLEADAKETAEVVSALKKYIVQIEGESAKLVEALEEIKAEFNRLKSNAKSLRDAVYLDGVLAVIESISGKLLEAHKEGGANGK